MGLRKQNTYTAFVNPRYTQTERNQIARAIINFIIERTKKGKGIGGVPFINAQGQTGYTKNYQKTVEFKIAGKNKKPINLSLSGDMLDSIEVIDVNTIGRIVIGFTSEFENDKSVFMEEKGYKFLGLSTQELNSIVQEFGPPEQEPGPANISAAFVGTFIRGIFGR
jgi:hypothetical protein